MALTEHFAGLNGQYVDGILVARNSRERAREKVREKALVAV